MKIAYICSRYKGNTEENIAEAKRFSQFAYENNRLPLCVHLFLNEVTGLSEGKGDREELLNLGLEFVKKSNELWVLDKDGISEGMEKEIKLAEELGKKVKYHYKTKDGEYIGGYQ